MSSSLSLALTSCVCAESILTGQITIGANTVVHPKAIIDASKGPIVIGSNCVLEEFSHVVSPVGGLIIGDYNLFEVSSAVACASVGSGNFFEIRCSVPEKVNITDGCTIGALVHLPASSSVSEIPANTVIFGAAQERRAVAENAKAHKESLKIKIEALKEILTKTHKIIK